MMTRTAILALTLALGSAPAFAAEDNAPAAATVRIGDLNLTTQQDQQRLETRLKNAARSVCSTGLRGLAAKNSEARCIENAMASAQPRAARAIAQAKGGKQLALLMITAR